MFKKYGVVKADSLEELAELLTELADTKLNFDARRIEKEDGKYTALYEYMSST